MDTPARSRDLSAAGAALATPHADKSGRAGSDTDTDNTVGSADPEDTVGPADPESTVGSADPESTARLIALRLLESQPRTRAELERALARRGVRPDAATAVLDRFVEVGLIDDEAFAQAWVTSRHAGKGLGRRALTVELQRRGVAAEAIGAAVSAVSADDEEVAARALVSRRLRTMAGLPAQTRVRRLVGMLARKGFSQALAVRIAREAVAASAAETSTGGDSDDRCAESDGTSGERPETPAERAAGAPC